MGVQENPWSFINYLLWEQRVVSSNPTAPTTYGKAASDNSR